MKNIMINKSLIDGDFLPLFSGEEECTAGHSFGPYIRDYYIIHFCLSGKGTLFDKDGEHKIEAGQLFIIRDGESTTYKADDADPWHYLWIATLGKRAEELKGFPTVIRGNMDFFERIKAVINNNESRPDIYCAFLFELFYLSSKKENEYESDKLSEIKRYIKYNYMLNINVGSLSKLFGFERSYLYRLFTSKYGIGVKDYIVKVRMEKAKELLLLGYSVKECGAMVGYSDQFAFSKAFKNLFKISPFSYKRGF